MNETRYTVLEYPNDLGVHLRFHWNQSQTVNVYEVYETDPPALVDAFMFGFKPTLDAITETCRAYVAVWTEDLAAR